MANFCTGQLGWQRFALGLEVSANDFFVLLGQLVQFFLLNLSSVAVDCFIKQVPLFNCQGFSLLAEPEPFVKRQFEGDLGDDSVFVLTTT